MVYFFDENTYFQQPLSHNFFFLIVQYFVSQVQFLTFIINLTLTFIIKKFSRFFYLQIIALTPAAIKSKFSAPLHRHKNKIKSFCLLEIKFILVQLIYVYYLRRYYA